jgi:hypothetical protein
MLVKKIQNSRFYGVDGTTTEMLVREPVATNITEVAEVSSTPTQTQESLNIQEPFLSPSETTIAKDEHSRDIPVATTTNNLNIEYNIERRPLLLERTPITPLVNEVVSSGGGFGGGFGGGGGGGAVEEEIIAPKKKSKWWLWLLVAGGIYGVSKMKKK